jgi:hypothetical protein
MNRTAKQEAVKRVYYLRHGQLRVRFAILMTVQIPMDAVHTAQFSLGCRARTLVKGLIGSSPFKICYRIAQVVLTQSWFHNGDLITARSSVSQFVKNRLSCLG